jgi:DnaK suppressor protein
MDENQARESLLAERDDLRRLLRGTEEAADSDLQSLDGPGDEIDASQELTAQTNDDAVASDLRTRLGVVERALARIEAGTYGKSVLSGKPIPDERLEADPAAELTIEEARAQR